MNSFYAGFMTAALIAAIILAANGYFFDAPTYFGLW